MPLNNAVINVQLGGKEVIQIQIKQRVCNAKSDKEQKMKDRLRGKFYLIKITDAYYIFELTSNFFYFLLVSVVISDDTVLNQVYVKNAPLANIKMQKE